VQAAETVTGMERSDTQQTPPAATPNQRQRLLRRSRTDRVAGGVAGGLGAYFDTDPVLFRAMFAVGAFFGGAGLVAYALAWAAIPDIGTDRAPVDGWITALRRLGIPAWLWAITAGLLVCVTSCTPHQDGAAVVPVLAIAALLILSDRRRGCRRTGALTTPDPGRCQPTVNLTRRRRPAPSQAAPRTSDGVQSRTGRPHRTASELAQFGHMANPDDHGPRNAGVPFDPADWINTSDGHDGITHTCWALAWHGHGGGNRIDVWLHRTEKAAWAAAARACFDSYFDGDPQAAAAWERGDHQAFVTRCNELTHPVRVEVTEAGFIDAFGQPA